MATRVMVVEDEPDIATLIQRTLERNGGMRVDIVDRGDAALQAIVSDVPDLVLLDINLPVVNGFDVCRMLRARPATAHIPIIMLTARGAETDRVSGLEMGADDYITKPFNLRELAARVNAVLRRVHPNRASAAESVYRGPHLVADLSAVAISVDGVAVHLTRTEFELLRCLIENRSRVLSRERLLDCVWGGKSTVGLRSVDVHMGRLRAKLQAAGDQIETVIGLGYRFMDPAPDAGDN